MHHIQIFVSSTFSDMHRERDLLHQIAGLINRDISHQGYQVILRDLRYGVDTAHMDDETEIEKKVLTQCFDAIDQCQIFVLLLGDRYGSVFEDLSIPRLYMPDRELEGKSVTHLEVEYGMLKINRERFVVFSREFQGDPASMPPHYRDTGSGAIKNQLLKESLYKTNQPIDHYSAQMKDGEFTIDEYHFVKHGQTFLQKVISDYINEHPASPDSKEGSLSEPGTSEPLSAVLIQEIDKKAAHFPEQFRTTAKELMMLRIQELLNHQDYDRINQLGSGGDAIEEYRRTLIACLPQDFMALLQEICRCVSSVVSPALDVFRMLQILASSQQTPLSQMGGISISELVTLFNQKDLPAGQTCGEWLRFRHDISGLDYAQHLAAQNALACFLGKGVLLTGSPTGYSFQDNSIAQFLRNTTSAAYRDNILPYIAKNFWYFPDPIGVWITFLENCQYSLALSCLEVIQANHRFTDKLLAFAEKFRTKEQIIHMLEGFLLWMSKKDGAEASVFYILSLCSRIAYDSDEDLADQQYEQWILPLYQALQRSYFEAHWENLTAAGKFLLWHIHNEVFDPYPDPLWEQEIEQAEILADAVFALFLDHDLTEPEGLNAYLRMVRDLTPYLCRPEQFLPLLQAAVIRDRAYWGNLCKNLVFMTFGNEVMEHDDLIRTLEAVMNIHCEEDSLLMAKDALNEQLMAYACRTENEALCIAAVHLLYGMVASETKLRRANWHSWITWIPCDIIDQLYDSTDDPIIQEIGALQEKWQYMGIEKLWELDDAYRKEMEDQYQYFRQIGSVSSC